MCLAGYEGSHVHSSKTVTHNETFRTYKLSLTNLDTKPQSLFSPVLFIFILLKTYGLLRYNFLISHLLLVSRFLRFLLSQTACV